MNAARPRKEPAHAGDRLVGWVCIPGLAVFILLEILGALQ